MKHYIVYIPGLGDGYDMLRRCLLFFWRIYGVKVEHVPMKWYDGKSYEEKYKRASAAARDAQALGYRVSVIGESAGASMAMNVFAHNESLHRMVSLSGVNNSNTPISPRILKRGPAFKESVDVLNDSQALALKSRSKHITSVTALSDSAVDVEKNIIPGVRHVKIWSVGHLITILLCLSVYSFVLISEVRRN